MIDSHDLCTPATCTAGGPVDAAVGNRSAPPASAQCRGDLGSSQCNQRLHRRRSRNKSNYEATIIVITLVPLLCASCLLQTAPARPTFTCTPSSPARSAASPAAQAAAAPVCCHHYHYPLLLHLLLLHHHCCCCCSSLRLLLGALLLLLAAAACCRWRSSGGLSSEQQHAHTAGYEGGKSESV